MNTHYCIVPMWAKYWQKAGAMCNLNPVCKFLKENYQKKKKSTKGHIVLMNLKTNDK